MQHVINGYIYIQVMCASTCEVNCCIFLLPESSEMMLIKLLLC